MLLVPAWITMTLGLTPSSSPCSRRQRMFCVRSAPQPKLRRVPAEEILPPVRQKVGIVGRAPAAGDRIADEVDVDAARSRLLEQLRMRASSSSDRCGVRLDPRCRSIRHGCRALRRRLWFPDRRGDRATCHQQDRQPCPGLHRTSLVVAAGACPRNLSAHGMKYFQFGPSVWPPSCWRHASWPSSRLTLTAGIFSFM